MNWPGSEEDTVLTEVSTHYGSFRNYIDGEFADSGSETQKIFNPATGGAIAAVPLSGEEDVRRAVDAAADAFSEWHEKPVAERVHYLFRLREIVNANAEDAARIIVQENGKTIDEARGEVSRGMENIDAAIAALYHLDGRKTTGISSGIDEELIREPLGVFAAVTPFNFPMMIPFWFLPYAVVTGNTFILKPSERTPVTMNYLFRRMHEAGLFPPGVVNIVNGARETVDAILRNKGVAGVSFVGSTAAAQHIYEECTRRKKRVQAQASAKNFVVVMPDAKISAVLPNVINSFFGNAGQRCLAGSNLVVFDENHETALGHFIRAASELKLGYGLSEETDMGPVISTEQKKRIVSYIEKGTEEGAELLLDGKEARVEEFPRGNFIGPSVFDRVTADMTIAKEEIFGPVASVIVASDISDAVEIANRSRYGNMSAIYTADAKNAREFALGVRAGNVGINIGVPAPAATYPFCGYKDSFFGDLHGQGGEDYVQFFTERKVVISRWL
jgi:malonate-semialdehyde dehydrogenase (acetylating)/methylmalonate-semialdehyde dehydrogenase